MATRSHLRRVLLAALVAVTVCSTTSATASVSTASTSACGELGTLKTYALNDRCSYGLLDPGLVIDSVIVDGLSQVGLFALLVNCTGGARRPRSWRCRTSCS